MCDYIYNIIITLKKILRKELRDEEDGGVGRHDTNLPPQSHQIYIYMWNNSHEN